MSTYREYLFLQPVCSQRLVPVPSVNNLQQTTVALNGGTSCGTAVNSATFGNTAGSVALNVLFTI